MIISEPEVNKLVKKQSESYWAEAKAYAWMAYMLLMVFSFAISLWLTIFSVIGWGLPFLWFFLILLGLLVGQKITPKK